MNQCCWMVDLSSMRSGYVHLSAMSWEIPLRQPSVTKISLTISFKSRSVQWEWELTHWGRVTHICVGKLTIIGSDNGRRQAIIRTNAGIVLIGPLRTNFSEIVIGIQTFSLKKYSWIRLLWTGVHFDSTSMFNCHLIFFSGGGLW